MIDPAKLLPIAEDHKSLTLGADVDLTAIWPDQGYARELRNNTTVAANISVITFKSSNAVIFSVQPGASIYGMFKTLVNATTTATAVVAGK